MKILNVPLEDKEHELIVRAKKKSGLAWREYLLSSASLMLGERVIDKDDLNVSGIEVEGIL